MARIRSVHPKLFTDESFASLSMASRVLIIGIWTEADDQGAFEWKPLSLKMRLFPADAVDVAAMLTELLAVNMVAKYEFGGREFGLVRNFRKYQRPKKPTYVYAVPDQYRTYVGLIEAIGAPDRDDGGQFPQKSELGKQREDEGGVVPFQEREFSCSEVVVEGQTVHVLPLARGGRP